jgi:hypothetical protein
VINQGAKGRYSRARLLTKYLQLQDLDKTIAYVQEISLAQHSTTLV